MNCVICDKPIGKKARTCGSTCRSKLARSVASSVARPSVASTVAPQKKASVARPEYIVDACGKSHKIDYETRAKNHEILASWARGEGTEYQRRLGVLASQY